MPRGWRSSSSSSRKHFRDSSPEGTLRRNRAVLSLWDRPCRLADGAASRCPYSEVQNILPRPCAGWAGGAAGGAAESRRPAGDCPSGCFAGAAPRAFRRVQPWAPRMVLAQPRYRADARALRHAGRRRRRPPWRAAHRLPSSTFSWSPSRATHASAHGAGSRSACRSRRAPDRRRRPRAVLRRCPYKCTQTTPAPHEGRKPRRECVRSPVGSRDVRSPVGSERSEPEPWQPTRTLPALPRTPRKRAPLRAAGRA